MSAGSSTPIPPRLPIGTSPSTSSSSASSSSSNSLPAAQHALSGSTSSTSSIAQYRGRITYRSALLLASLYEDLRPLADEPKENFLPDEEVESDDEVE